MKDRVLPVLVVVGLCLPLSSAVSAAVPGAARSTQQSGPCRPTITGLPLISGAVGSSVVGGRGDRLLVGGLNERDGSSRPVLWRRTGPTTWRARDLSRGGTVLGNANSIDRRHDILISSGWVITPNGRYHQLKDFGTPSTSVFARQLNSNGVIVGAVFGPDPDEVSAGARWPSFRARPRHLNPLPFPGSADSLAEGVNDHGDAVGNSNTADFSDFRGGVWRNRHRAGRLLPGLEHSGHAFPFRINNSGRVVGEVANGDFSRDGAGVWSRTGRLHFLGDLLPTDNSASLVGLSQNGRAVGSSGDGDQFRLIYWPGHGPLKTLRPLSGDWATGDAGAHYVSNDGLVGGDSVNAHGVDVATVWTCAGRQAFVPHPS
jgi:uncharacterized membrane protein